MKGFIKNEGTENVFKLQRHLPPGAIFLLDDAYKIVGKKSGLKGLAFVEWLKKTFFNEEQWKFYKNETQLYIFKDLESRSQIISEGHGAGKTLRRKSDDSNQENTSADNLVLQPFSQAKNLIEKCKSRSVLKKALTLSKQMYGKEDHMRELLKRLEQVI